MRAGLPRDKVVTATNNLSNKSKQVESARENNYIVLEENCGDKVDETESIINEYSRLVSERSFLVQYISFLTCKQNTNKTSTQQEQNRNKTQRNTIQLCIII